MAQRSILTCYDRSKEYWNWANRRVSEIAQELHYVEGYWTASNGTGSNTLSWRWLPQLTVGKTMQYCLFEFESI